jgi:heat shock protein HslJ
MTAARRTKQYTLVGQSRVSMNFTDDGRLIASAGCNTMSGPVRLDGGRLEVSELQTTDMGCEAPLHEQDTWLGNFLSGTPSWRHDGTSLVVNSPSTEIVLQDRKIVEPDLALRGTRWSVDGLVQGETASSVPAGTQASLVFEQDAVQVSAGCNTGSGKYQLSGDTIRFEPVATTRKACEPDVMTLESAVLAVLEGEAKYTIEADRLTLTHPSGKGLQLRGAR